MIYDTRSQETVGTAVYDLARNPKGNDQIKSDQLTVPFERPSGD